MKTLIFYGSPHSDGDTMALLREMKNHLAGEVVMVNAYRARIAPCVDCRMCQRKRGCVIRDDMEKVYEDLADCDNVVVAAPLYMGEVPGMLLNVFSRLQAMYSAKFFLHQPYQVKEKRGGVILSGGGSGGEERALATVEDVFRHYMGVKESRTVMSLHTDSLPAAEDMEALSAARLLGGFLSEERN